MQLHRFSTVMSQFRAFGQAQKAFTGALHCSKAKYARLATYSSRIPCLQMMMQAEARAATATEASKSGQVSS